MNFRRIVSSSNFRMSSWMSLWFKVEDETVGTVSTRLVNSNNERGIKSEQQKGLCNNKYICICRCVYTSCLIAGAICRLAKKRRNISTCVPSQKNGGRNNVAFVGQRNGEARLKRKAKSDWNTRSYVRLSSPVLFPSPSDPSATVFATVVSTPFIFCITISGTCTCALVQLHKE